MLYQSFAAAISHLVLTSVLEFFIACGSREKGVGLKGYTNYVRRFGGLSDPLCL
jgi:hypothetical protein